MGASLSSGLTPCLTPDLLVRLSREEWPHYDGVPDGRSFGANDEAQVPEGVGNPVL
jgi:hypothetical protein